MSENELFPPTKHIKVNLVTDGHATPYDYGNTENNATLENKEVANETECEQLPKDVYSLLYFEKNEFDMRIVAFVILVFVAQVSLLSIILVDLMDNDEKKEWPYPPANVSSQVRFSQYFSIILAIMTQEDFFASIRTGVAIISFRERLQEQEVSWKFFFFGCILKLCIGLLGLSTAMFIIIQSDKVIDLLADFAAMYVVSLADNAAFTFAESGYITDFLQLRSKKVKKKSIFLDNEIITINNCVRRYIMVFVALIMLSMNIWIQIKQRNGDYFTHSIDFYVGDEIDEWPAYFNGEYKWNEKFLDGRPVYVQKECKCVNTTVPCCPLIRYCKRDQRWVWTNENENQMLDQDSLCDEISMYSTETVSYDILDVSTLQWHSWSNTQFRFVKEKTLSIKNNECQSDKECEGGNKCSEEKRCVCHNSIGNHCENRLSCKVLQIDRRDNGFKDYSPTYKLLGDDKNITYNHRPIYYIEYKSNFFDLIFFQGSRWALTTTKLIEYQPLKKEQDLIYFFTYNFSSGVTFYLIDFISQQDFGYSPIGLTWYAYISDILRSKGENGQLGRLQETDAILYCNDCGDFGYCGNGKCINDKCECDDGYGGLKCQIPLFYGEFSIYSRSNKSYCSGCFDFPLWFDEENHQNGIYCAEILEKPIKIGSVDTNIEIGANSTHLYLSFSKEKKCDTGDLIRAIERRSDGNVINYEEVFLFNSTHVTTNYLDNPCVSTYKKDYSQICVKHEFSDFIDEEFFFKVRLQILNS